jgi:hypothetical protein
MIVLSSFWYRDDFVRELKKLKFKYLNNIHIVGTNKWGTKSEEFKGYCRDELYEDEIIVSRKGIDQYKRRGRQICEWLSLYAEEEDIYCVLDDEIYDISSDRYPIIPREYVVEVDGECGLSNSNVNEVIGILNGDK